MMTRLLPLLVPALVTALMGAVLVGLGIWQLQRLVWKNAIVARIESRAGAPAQPLPSPATWRGLAADDYEYRRVTLAGTFDYTEEALVFRGTAEGPGYFVLTPLHLASGGSVIVNRGFVPADRADAAARRAANVAGPVEVIGLMRSTEPRNPFTPADDPASGRYFTRDPILVAAHFGLADAAPFSIDADATANPGGLPRGGMTMLAIPNNHLSYALTWFGLAIGLLGVFATFVWRRIAVPDEAAGRPHRVPV